MQFIVCYFFKSYVIYHFNNRSYFSFFIFYRARFNPVMLDGIILRSERYSCFVSFAILEFFYGRTIGTDFICWQIFVNLVANCFRINFNFRKRLSSGRKFLKNIILSLGRNGYQRNLAIGGRCRRKAKTIFLCFAGGLNFQLFAECLDYSQIFVYRSLLDNSIFPNFYCSGVFPDCKRIFSKK